MDYCKKVGFIAKMLEISGMAGGRKPWKDVVVQLYEKSLAQVGICTVNISQTQVSVYIYIYLAQGYIYIYRYVTVGVYLPNNTLLLSYVHIQNLPTNTVEFYIEWCSLLNKYEMVYEYIGKCRNKRNP